MITGVNMIYRKIDAIIMQRLLSVVSKFKNSSLPYPFHGLHP